MAWRNELRPVLRLAAPLALAELGWTMMGIVDTIMVGRLPDAAIAIGAVSVGSLVFYTVAIYGGALLLGLDTLVSQAFGAGDLDECHRCLWNGVALAAIITPAVMGINLGVAELLPHFGVNPAVLPAAMSYLKILNWSTPPLIGYFAFRRYLQGRGLVKAVMFALVTANLVNLFGNWVLVYGNLGAPAMGTDGSAWSTVIARVYLLAVLVGYAAYRDARDGSGLFRVKLRPEKDRMRRLLGLGAPAATHVALEIGVFGCATALIARLDANSLAAHQIALNAASCTFMVPLGISSAAAVRVGHRIGARDYHGAGRSGWMAIAIGVAFMACAAVAFVVIPHRIARLYTPDAGVIRTSVALLGVAALFQLFDGCQIIAAGALRGAGDTRTPMLCNLLFYWFVGLPLGYWLCFGAKWGAIGLWTGLCVSLVLIGSTLLMVWHRKARSLGVLPR